MIRALPVHWSEWNTTHGRSGGLVFCSVGTLNGIFSGFKFHNVPGDSIFNVLTSVSYF
jgi:hypothetical protein